MANNKVQLADGSVLIDLTDTTAVAADVAQGKYFYGADGIKQEGLAEEITIDSSLSDTSTNPVQNKVIKAVADSCQKISFANINTRDTLVPFYCEAGDVLIMSAENSDTFSVGYVRFFNENGEQITYWATHGLESPRTLTIPTNKPKHYFVSVTGGTSDQAIKIINQTKLNADYENSTAKVNIDTKITAPSSPATGSFLVWNGSAWVAQTLAAWQGGSY